MFLHFDTLHIYSRFPTPLILITSMTYKWALYIHGAPSHTYSLPRSQNMFLKSQPDPQLSVRTHQWFHPAFRIKVKVPLTYTNELQSLPTVCPFCILLHQCLFLSICSSNEFLWFFNKLWFNLHHVCLFVFVVLRYEPQDLVNLKQDSTTEPHPQLKLSFIFL